MKEHKVGRIIGRILLVLLTLVLLLAVAVVGVVWVILRGPSKSAQELLTRSMKETSAIGFIPDLFLPAERVAEIMRYTEETPEEEPEMDVSLVTIRAVRGEAAPGTGTETEAAGQSAVPGMKSVEDGIGLVEITGSGYRGILMIVEDPSRLFLGTPDSYGGVGLTLGQMVEKYGAVAGINAGGFYDPNGSGNGGTPDGIVISEGKLVFGDRGSVTSVIGFDADGVLHVGSMSAAEALNRNIRWACSFGPALIVNGEAMGGSYISGSGINPRTAIGQRADGAVLLLVVDGRQIASMGATLEDLISIFLEYGAVNAANLDGGSSTEMIYAGESLNNNSSAIGARPLPTAFLVR